MVIAWSLNNHRVPYYKFVSISLTLAQDKRRELEYFISPGYDMMTDVAVHPQHMNALNFFYVWSVGENPSMMMVCSLNHSHSTRVSVAAQVC